MPEILMALLRHALTLGSGALMSKGLVDQSEGEQLVSCILGLVGIGWSILHKYQVKQQLATAVATNSPTVH